MPDITFTLTSDQLNRLVSATCARFNYQAVLENPQTGETSPNPETQAQFTKRMWKEQMVDIVKSYEVKVAEEAARTNYVPLNVT